MDWGKVWLVDFNAGKTQLVSFDQSNNTGATDVKIDGKIIFYDARLPFSSKFSFGFYIISVAKTASKNIGALICSTKFLSPVVALHLYYKSTIQPCVGYCCHFGAGALSCYSQTCLYYHLYKTTTHLRLPMLSPPKPIPKQSLLYKTTICLMRPVTFFCSPNEKKQLLQNFIQRKMGSSA